VEKDAVLNVFGLDGPQTSRSLNCAPQVV